MCLHYNEMSKKEALFNNFIYVSGMVGIGSVLVSCYCPIGFKRPQKAYLTTCVTPFVPSEWSAFQRGRAKHCCSDNKESLLRSNIRSEQSYSKKKEQSQCLLSTAISGFNCFRQISVGVFNSKSLKTRNKSLSYC